jgi:hypothetical protein
MIGGYFMGEYKVKNELEQFLTVKHQLHLLVQILDGWILPSEVFDQYDKAALINASDLISTVHTSLESQFKETIQGFSHE